MIACQSIIDAIQEKVDFKVVLKELLKIMPQYVIRHVREISLTVIKVAISKGDRRLDDIHLVDDDAEEPQPAAYDHN